MVTCATPDLGRIQAVGLFLLDDCMRPIFGEDAGYLDDCPAAVTTSDNLDEQDDFTRRCANGDIKINVPGKTSLLSIKTDVDFHWIDPTWLAQAGATTAITQNDTVIGSADGANDRFNVLIVVWQELLGDDACSNEEGLAGSYVRLYPLKNARITEEGDLGSSESYMRISGKTTGTHELGSGPLELALGDEGPEWLEECLPSGTHRLRFIGAPFPEECGTIETVEPTTTCVEAS